jgi:hypothetical protein
MKEWHAAREPGFRRRYPPPADLSRCCCFAAAFAFNLFGGRIRGNRRHCFLETTGGVVDLAAGSAQVQRFIAEGRRIYLHSKRIFADEGVRGPLSCMVAETLPWAIDFLRERRQLSRRRLMDFAVRRIRQGADEAFSDCDPFPGPATATRSRAAEAKAPSLPRA